MPRSRILAVALSAMLALFVTACDDKTSPPTKKAPAPEYGLRRLILKAWVSGRCSPYTLHLESTGQGLIPEPTLHIAAGGWEHAVTYRFESRFQFTIKVEAKRGCAEGWCAIDDGMFGSAQDSLNQYGTAKCVYTTKGQ